jgi:hypothetical protein
MVVTVMAVTLVNCMSVTVMPVTVEAIGMAAQSIGMGTPIGMVAIGMYVAIGIGGTVDGGPMVLALVGEWFLAAGFGSVTDDPRRAETLHLSEKLFPLITTKRGQIGTSVEHPQWPQGYFSEQQEIPTTSPRSTGSAARRLVS